MANNQQQQQEGNKLHDQQDFSAMEMKLRRIPGVILRQMMLEAGINDDRGFGNLSLEEKTRLNEVLIRTIDTYTGTASGAPRNDSLNQQPSDTNTH